MVREDSRMFDAAKSISCCGDHLRKPRVVFHNITVKENNNYKKCSAVFFELENH